MSTKVILACLVIVVLAVSIVNATTSESNNNYTSPKENISLSINIKSVKIIPAAPGNSKPVNLSVRVVNLVNQTNICGLNASNFRIETLGVPPYGAAVAIKNVSPITTIAKNKSDRCNYLISIVPATYQGKQNIWKAGP
ncbi:MAG: hypothetical protein NTY37_10770, partial [Methanothrix sp.]|nr:hypothetical protein [Methanothrix sp.]